MYPHFVNCGKDSVAAMSVIRRIVTHSCVFQRCFMSSVLTESCVLVESSIRKIRAGSRKELQS